MNVFASPVRQRGIASLLVALVLMLSMSLITLSTARTQWAETQMVGNEYSHYRLRLRAESGWEQASDRLLQITPLKWRALDGALVSQFTAPAGREGVRTRVLLRRAAADNPFISLQAVARQADGEAPTGRVSQTLRLLTVLTPLAETAPPLILNGCLSTVSAMDLYPRASDSSAAGAALWQFARAACPLPRSVDVHGGGLVDNAQGQPADSLWGRLFTVTREDYAQLANADLASPAARRRYWLAGARPGTLVWRLSLGSVAQPVVLVFPAAAGCPRFAAGVHIVGLVLIESDCPDPLAAVGVEITGTLAVDGALNTGNARLRLKHIQVADPARSRLALPALRGVRVPGSWRDF